MRLAVLTGTIRGNQQRPSQTNSKTKAEEKSALQRQGRSECELFYFVVCESSYSWPAKL